MIEVKWGAVAVALAVVLGGSCTCTPPVRPGPRSCLPVPPQRPGLPDEVVWGFADLHAHPGIERAFKGALIWGSAVDEAEVNAAELPSIAACPVETHLQRGTGPLDRSVGLQVFPAVANIASYAHAPVATGGLRSTTAWPNARDVIHQQMNVASIRRAYEGGLRLMFASTTDDQVIATLLTGPNFVDAVVPNATADYESARAQIELIREIVARNSSWMGLARTPPEARRIIREGRLALVVSLEMNGLREDDVDRLVRDQDARHVFPIHLIDNDIGGTAAFASLFNSASATVSALYREDRLPGQYLDLVSTPGYSRPLGWPEAIVTSPKLPIYVGLSEIHPAAYQALCYQPLAACTRADPVPTSFIEFGQQNLKGLCTTAKECLADARPGAERIRRLLDAGLMIDLSHMSARAAAETLAIEGAPPLIASHGDVAHLCRGNPTGPPCTDSAHQPPSERDLDAELARKLVSRQGVLGLGTGRGVYASRTLIAARGAPLFALAPDSELTLRCAAQPGSDGGPTVGCEVVPDVDRVAAGTLLGSLRVETEGAPQVRRANAQPFVRVELRDPVGEDQFQRQVLLVPMDCSAIGCSATVKLAGKNGPSAPKPAACDPLHCEDAGSCSSAPYTVDDLESVTLEWLYLECDASCQADAGQKDLARQCHSTWDDPLAPSWPMTRIEVFAGQSTTPLAQLTRGAGPLVTLGGKVGTFTAWRRHDRPGLDAGVPISGHLLRVSVTSGVSGQGLPGASAQQVGANACVAVRRRVDGVCRPVGPPRRGATDCPTGDGWAALNQRGEWKPGLTLYTFVRFPGHPSTACGVDLAILDWPPLSPPFHVAAVRVEAIEDPLGHWVRRYAEIAKHVAGGRLGTVALGTDFNGLNGLTDISERPVPPGALAASACPAAGAAPPPGSAPLELAPLRLRNPNGTLGGAVLLEERGLATYGLLADFVALVGAYPGCGADVRDSLMLSAEATLRAWEATLDAGVPGRAPLPRASFSCGAPPELGP